MQPESHLWERLVGGCEDGETLELPPEVVGEVADVPSGEGGQVGGAPGASAVGVRVVVGFGPGLSFVGLGLAFVPCDLGVPFDLRRAHPYSAYPELDFDIPTRAEGDALARYLLRGDEIKQSLRIIDQCLHQMPDGPVMAKLPRLMRPRPGRAWAGIEGPRGEYGVYAISDGTDQPFRFRIHDPSFLHLQSFSLLVSGNLIADWMAVNASLDPIMGGVDK